jgi:hypothetical protein
MTLEEEMINKASEELMHEVDREILWGMLQGIGWTRVMLPTYSSNKQAIDILCWLEDNCKESYERRGRDFIFENQKDAEWFMLRWL